MLRIIITAEMKEWARDKAQRHVKGKRFDSDIDKRNSVYLGYLGDAVFHKEYPYAEHCDLSDYDFILAHNKIDVKAWWSKYKPKPAYFVQIPAIDMDRRPEVYVFVCLNEGHGLGWIVGWIYAEAFKKLAAFRKKDEERGLAIKYTADCFEMQVSGLGTF